MRRGSGAPLTRNSGMQPLFFLPYCGAAQLESGRKIDLPGTHTMILRLQAFLFFSINFLSFLFFLPRQG
jgi:hypothetical protein